MVVQKKKVGTVTKAAGTNRAVYCSDSLASKLSLVIVTFVLGMALMMVGYACVFLRIPLIPWVMIGFGWVLELISGVLSIGAWILFGKKMDQIEASGSANAAQIHDLAICMAETNKALAHMSETLDGLYSVTYQAYSQAGDGAQAEG